MHPLAPHTISLALQYTIPPSELPTHLVSRPLLQRHHFLSISPSDPSYLCWPHPGADPHKTVAALELLATQDHEQLVRTAQIRYQTAEPVYARVWLGDVVQLVFVWEEDEDGAGWRYFDAGKLITGLVSGADHCRLPPHSPWLQPLSCQRLFCQHQCISRGRLLGRI